MPDKPDHQKAAEIVRDAGGTIVGRTRLQKVGCLLELAGLGSGFKFEYHYYGPYSEALTEAVRMAEAFDLMTEKEQVASWGGTYSIFTTSPGLGTPDSNDRSRFAQEAAKIDAIELELAATAAFLAAVEGRADAWEETARRKPDKAGNGRLEKAKLAYGHLSSLKSPKPLPNIL